MKKETVTPYLDFYYKSLESGYMTSNGLCGEFYDDEYFMLIDPDRGGMETFWGYDGECKIHYGMSDKDLSHKFTEFRQTVVLLMAAMAGEL